MLWSMKETIRGARMRHTVTWILTTTVALAGASAALAQTSGPDLDRVHQHETLLEQAVNERQGPQGQTWIERIKTSEPDLERSLDWLIQNGEGERALRFADSMRIF